jgi:hypothetical protein
MNQCKGKISFNPLNIILGSYLDTKHATKCNDTVEEMWLYHYNTQSKRQAIHLQLNLHDSITYEGKADSRDLVQQPEIPSVRKRKLHCDNQLLPINHRHSFWFFQDHFKYKLPQLISSIFRG